MKYGSGPRVTYCEATGKRRYGSERAARQACATLNARVRVYRCEYCHDVHVANADKRGRGRD
jgi:hypothetical protein